MFSHTHTPFEFLPPLDVKVVIVHGSKTLRLLSKERSRPHYGMPLEDRPNFAFLAMERDPSPLQCQNLEAAGLGRLLPSLEVWKGSTVAGPLPVVDGGRTMEVYLQRWPADKKVRVVFLCVSVLVWFASWFGLVDGLYFLVITCHSATAFCFYCMMPIRYTVTQCAGCV